MTNWNIKSDIIELTSSLIDDCSSHRLLKEWALSRNINVTLKQEMDLSCTQLNNQLHKRQHKKTKTT